MSVPNQTSPVEPELDQLVDGELTDARRRDLLSRLEGLPDGWRRCALAFLEAQAWRQAASDAVREPAAPRVAPARLAQRWWTGGAGTLLAMAASFGLAFALGIVWHGWSPVGTDRTQSDVAGPTSGAGGGQQPLVATHEAEKGNGPKRRVDAVLVRMNGQDQPVRVPVVPVEQFDQDLLNSQPWPISSDELHAIEQSGHRVEQHRQWLPFNLQDGQQIIVPVDQVDVQYLGHQ